MFCPEDGAEIPAKHIGTSLVEYDPCPHCRATYIYSSEDGTYRVVPTPASLSAAINEQAEAPLKGTSPYFADQTEALLAEAGKGRRELGVKKMVDLIIDAMVATARRDGQCTYYTGTFAVARETIVNSGLTCELDPDARSRLRGQGFVVNPVRWVAFFGDDYEFIGLEEATKHLTAERS